MVSVGDGRGSETEGMRDDSRLGESVRAASVAGVVVSPNKLHPNTINPRRTTTKDLAIDFIFIYGNQKQAFLSLKFTTKP
jgi:hypothetical protein